MRSYLKSCSCPSRINNCVGEDNHWLFLQLCFYTQVLSLFTLVLDFCQYYYFQPLTELDQVHSAGNDTLRWREENVSEITDYILDMLIVGVKVIAVFIYLFSYLKNAVWQPGIYQY